jgi:hypothetical protein
VVEREGDQMRKRACPQKDIWHDALPKSELDDEHSQSSFIDQEWQRQTDDSAGSVRNKGIVIRDRAQSRCAGYRLAACL